MADFTIPFGADGEFRFPTATESEQGFLCGPADRALFSGLFNRIEAEVGEVIQYAGLSGTDNDLTQLRQAIMALISAATGGNPAGYVLMSQARARLPFFPEVLNADGRIGVTAPATGTVRLAGGVNFLHRGIYQETSTQTDFLTDPSKTYHLRWDPVNGYRLRDLAGVGYNPTALVETNAVFDSSYDDMLIARVITNSSNVATITTLANKSRLAQTVTADVDADRLLNWGTLAGTAMVTNWARRPNIAQPVLQGTKSWSNGITGDAWITYSPTVQGSGVGLIANTALRLPASGFTRYGIPNLEYVYDDTVGNNGHLFYTIQALAL